jgi:CRP-like cAMP-binding protein
MIDIEKLRQIYKFSQHLRLEDAFELIKSSKTKTFQKKEILIEPGSLKNDLFFVRKGLIRQYIINEKGEDITFRLIPENFVASNADLILYNNPSRYFYETLEKTRTFCIDFKVVEEILEKNQRLQLSRIRFAQRMMRDMNQRIESFILFTPEERYINYIKEFPDMANRVPDKYLASILGITPVSLSRIRGRIASQKK